MSTKAKIITGLIYLLAAALLVAVVYVNLHEVETPDAPTVVDMGSDATVTTTADLPYNAAASDKYADLEPLYTVEEVRLNKDNSGVWSAFVDGKKVTDYTGVAKSDYGWFFVRDGEVDFHYNGIAGNERGNWFIKNGKVDFEHTGTFTVNGNTYKVVEGQVMGD